MMEEVLVEVVSRVAEVQDRGKMFLSLSAVVIASTTFIQRSNEIIYSTFK